MSWESNGLDRQAIRFDIAHESFICSDSCSGPREAFWLIFYATILVIFACFTVLTVEQRSLLLVDVLRDRGALLRDTSEGRVENAYILKLINCRW